MHHLLDLSTYPLDHPESDAYAALVAKCRADLAEHGMFELPGFMRPEAVSAAVENAVPVMVRDSFRHARSHNIYFRDKVEGLADDHPALTKCQTINHTICGDQIPDSPMIAIYEWQPFADFLAATMGKTALYQMNDPIGRVNIQASRDGEALNWHFDQSEFTTTILLQSPEEGGELEYRRNLRSADNPNYDGIAAALQGKDPLVKKQKLKPGALNVFRGVNTLHRVVPVKGKTERLVTIFSYYERPGVTMSPESQLGFYGRVATAA